MHRKPLTPETQRWLVYAAGFGILQLIIMRQTPTLAMQNALIATGILSTTALVTQLAADRKSFQDFK
jgi:hypothetical protein